MADDLHYVGGDWYFLDNNSGFKTRASRSRLQWNGIRTSGTKWNPRQPQDCVQAVRDEQAPPWAFPRQVNQFTAVASYVTAPSLSSSHSITVKSAEGMLVGDICQVPLDQTSNIFQFTISSIVGNVLSWVSPGLPGTVGTGFGDPIENQVINISATQRNAVVPGYPGQNQGTE